MDVITVTGIVLACMDGKATLLSEYHYSRLTTYKHYR